MNQLIFQRNSDIFSAILTQLVRSPLATYSSLCSTCVTYGTACHAIGEQLLPAVFKASLGAGSSTSKLAGLHADLWNIAPTRLFVWMTAIHKRYTSRFYLKARLTCLFGTKWSNPVKLEKRKKVWYLFLRVFLTAISKVYVFDGRLGTGLRVHANLRFFWYFPNFLRS